MLARRIREAFGESQKEIAKMPEPFTTRSLDAMVAQARGLELFQAGALGPKLATAVASEA